MAEVSPGVIWIGKADESLRRWDGTNINLVPHKFPQGYPQTRAILAAQDGSCWVAGAQGVWHGTPLAFPQIKDAYNLHGFSADGKSFSLSSDMDGTGHLYSANLLGSSISWNGSTFKLGPVNGPNAVSSATISLPEGRYSTLNFLATAVNGSQESQVFVVRYTDGTISNYTQSLSDWKTPQNQIGESIALAMPYRNLADGTQQDHNFYLYGYSFNLNSNKTVSTLSLPANSHVIVLAVSSTPEVQSMPPATEMADRSLIQLPKLVVNALCEDSTNRIWFAESGLSIWKCEAAFGVGVELGVRVLLPVQEM